MLSTTSLGTLPFASRIWKTTVAPSTSVTITVSADPIGWLKSPSSQLWGTHRRTLPSAHPAGSSPALVVSATWTARCPSMVVSWVSVTVNPSDVER